MTDSKNFHTSRSRKVTIMDVAREAGVSYSTVSRVLNGFELVKPATRQRVQNVAERLGYVANLQARSLAGGRSRVIGLLVPGLETSFIGEVIRGVDEEIAHAQYDLMLYTTHRNRGKEAAYVNTIVNGLADGLLLIVPLMPAAFLKVLPSHQYPYVLVDQADPSGKGGVVDATNWQGAYEATRYLISIGHRRIGFITGQMQLSSAVDRLQGYRDALRDYQVNSDESLVVTGDFQQSSGYIGASQLLDLPDRPTAIFASNDLTAFGAMEAIQERGLRIPDDISIVGFDDVPQAVMTHPKLTTVRQPLAQMGRIAARMLLELIENPELSPSSVTLATELIIRDSCRSIP